MRKEKKMRFDVDANELLAAAKFADNKLNKNRPVLQNVYIQMFADKYVIASTDSFKVIEFTHNVERSAEDLANWKDFSFMISIADIKNAVKSSDSFVAFDCVEDSKTIDAGMWVERNHGLPRIKSTLLIQDGTFPSYNRVFDDMDNKKESDSWNIADSAYFDVTYLADACKAIKSAYGKDARIRIDATYKRDGVQSAMGFGWKNDDSAYCRGLLMPVRMD